MKWTWAGSITLLACSGAALFSIPTNAQDNASLEARPREQIFAITTQNRLLKLNVNGRRGVTVASTKNVTGLRAMDRLVGIDFRPSDGLLYALGSPNGGAGAGQLYTIDTRTAAATMVGSGEIPLAGTAFGFDFNPVPDLIRITSNEGENKRVSPVTGALVMEDGQLAYPAAGDPNAGMDPAVVASAYTNPDTDPLTNTVLYELDVRSSDADGDVLAIQVPPNAGTLNTVGRTGVDASEVAGFDISASGVGLAAINPSGTNSSNLVLVDLISGAFQNLGKIGRGSGDLVAGIAVQPTR